jgi:hypothetical protein
MERMLGHARLFFMSLLLLPMVGCAENIAWRGGPTCKGDPSCAVIRSSDDFDLAFVEFTERGNVFDRKKMDEVLERVTSRAKEQNGVMAIVFTHGWKHNASPQDENVANFEKWLIKAARFEVTEGQQKQRLIGPRRLIGIYIGWRGLSLDLGPLTNVSYWERKAVAHEVGKGGVTEFLLRLEHALVDKTDPNKNLSLVVGHSFGGAVVLTALNEILLERVIAAEPGQCGKKPKPGCTECVRTRSFGHGVVLLNPAIEANEVLQLKELVAEKCFAQDQGRLMHVISSDADQATNKAFRLGQKLWSWRQDQTRFERTFGGTSITLEESELDTITLGNFKPFQTGQLSKPAEPGGVWRYDNCVNDPDKACLSAKEDKSRHIPVWGHEPLAFIHTDKDFIGDHNAIFTNNVAAYLAAIVVEARLLRAKDPIIPSLCRGNDGAFDFGHCLKNFLTEFGAAGKPASP